MTKTKSRRIWTKRVKDDSAIHTAPAIIGNANKTPIPTAYALNSMARQKGSAMNQARTQAAIKMPP